MRRLHLLGEFDRIAAVEPSEDAVRNADPLAPHFPCGSPVPTGRCGSAVERDFRFLGKTFPTSAVTARRKRRLPCGKLLTIKRFPHGRGFSITIGPDLAHTILEAAVCPLGAYSAAGFPTEEGDGE
jgi:hypothetical protein